MRLFSLLFLLFFQAQAFEGRSGDVLVQSFDCGECRLIQSETNSPYVHSGLLIRNEMGELQVAEALGPVGLTPLSVFLARGKINTLFRPKEFVDLSLDDQKKLDEDLRGLFFKKYQGLPFDSAFLWDNVDSLGRESLYCAEFVGKILNNFLEDKIIPQPMSYKKNYELWKRIFRGNVPDGLPGLSPAYFSRSELFIKVEDVKNL